MKKTLIFLHHHTHWAFVSLLVVLLMAAPAKSMAEKQAYARFYRNTLTFYYNNDKGGNNDYSLNTLFYEPEWKSKSGYVEKVVFDESFKDYAPTTCSKWFKDMSLLTSIEGMGNLNTSEVVYMDFMFSQCGQLSSIDLSHFNTDNVNDMSYMFSGTGVKSLDLSSFSTGNVTKMAGMFSFCDKLETLYVSNFNTSKVYDMASMFASCSALTTLDLSKFDTGLVEDMANMFSGCKSLTSLKVSSFSTAKVTNMSDMFSGCQSLTSIDVSSFSTDKVTNMSGMFNGCTALNSLGVSSFNTANVTNMADMFKGCQSLNSLGVSSFNTANVTNMSGMFSGCSALGTLDISTFDISKVTDMSFMFDGCSSVTEINSGGFKNSVVENLRATFRGCKSIFDNLDISGLNTQNVTDMSEMFRDCESFRYFPNGEGRVDTSVFITSKVTNMSKMFSGCTNLIWIPIEKCDVSNVTNMSGLFSGCKSLEIGDLDDWNTAKVTDMSDMFYGCSSIRYLYPRWNFSTVSVTNMSRMFCGCSSLLALDPTYFNTANVESMDDMFNGCSSLSNLDPTHFNTANVKSMANMFKGCSKLPKIDVSTFSTDNVTDMQGMFADCASMERLDLVNFNTAKATDMSNMFSGCTSLKRLDISKFSTDNVTNMQGMFADCANLAKLDLASFNTAKVADMGKMFYGDSTLTTIYVLGDFTTAAATKSDDMFTGCKALKGAVSYDENNTDAAYANYQTGYLSWWKGMYARYADDVLTFYYNSDEQDGDYSVNTLTEWQGKVDPTKVVFDKSCSEARPSATNSWFAGMTKLTSIEGMENLNTSEATSTESMFKGCTALKKLDLTNLNTSQVTNMNSMFNGCTSLDTICASSRFTTQKLASSKDMFTGCKALNGVISYDENKVDGSYANYRNGYFITIAGRYDFVSRYSGKHQYTLYAKGTPLTVSYDSWVELDDSASLVMSDDDEYIIPKIEYYRYMTSSWGTLCLPFDFDAPFDDDNWDYYSLQSVSPECVTLTKVDSGTVEAGTPIIIYKREKSHYYAYIHNYDAPVAAAPVNANSGVRLVGTFTDQVLKDEGYFIANDKFYSVADYSGDKGVKLKRFHAYITGCSASAPSLRIDIGDDAAGIGANEVVDDLNNTAAEYYDAAGRRISELQKGLNIVKTGNRTMKVFIK